MESGTDLRAVGDRLQPLLEELRSSADPELWVMVEEALALVTALYGGGLKRVMDLVQSAPPHAGGRLLDQLIDDDLVASLLVLHDLHPLDMAARVRRALDGVRPYLGSHGGDVEVLAVDEGVVRLRMLGSCDGCPSSAVTLELAVEHAIREAVPEVDRIEVEGLGPSAPAAREPVAAPVVFRQREPA
ncbi:MAG: NifU family protein [Acidimicrobiales bacterium]